ncbi:MAG: PAS domain S-box protein [Bacteroidales bacterium]|nr:PAS domain S-box protein [Bacteroidales bacterium]
MKINSPFRVILADSSGGVLQVPQKEIQRRNLDVTRITNVKAFDDLINRKGFNLIFICLDNDEFPDEKIVAAIRRSSKNNLDTPIVVSLTSHPENKLIDRLYKAGTNDIVFDSGNENHLLSKIYLFQQLFLKVAKLNQENGALRKKNAQLEKRNGKLTQQLKQDKILLQKTYKELSNEIDKNVNTILKLNEQSLMLTEKVKELDCLIAIAAYSEEEDTPMETFFSKTVNSIARAFHRDEKALVEIIYNNQHFRSANLKKAKKTYCMEICFQQELAGQICIYYPLKTLETFANPFPPAKKQFLSTVANNLGQIIRRKEVSKRLKIFQRAVDQSPLMISVVNLKTKKIEFVNPMFTKMLGISMEDTKNAEQLINISDRKLSAIRKEVKQTVLKGKTWKGTYQNKKKNGQRFWQRTAIYPLFENGEVAYSLGISEDITGEVRISKELKISRDSYEHIARYVPSGIIIVNKQGRLLFANEKAAAITGYSVAELYKTNITTLTHPDVIEETKTRLAARLKGLEVKNNFETRIVTKKGETRTIEASGVLTKWKDKTADLILFNDITEKKHFSDLLNIQYSIDYLSTIPVGLDYAFARIFETLFRYEWIDAGGIYLMNENARRLELVFNIGLSDGFVKASRFVPKKSERFKLVQQKKTLYHSCKNYIPFPKNLSDEGIKAIFIFPLVHDDSIIGVLNLATRSEVELTAHERLILESIGNRITQMITLINIQNELKEKNQELQQTLKDIQEKHQLLIQKSKLESLGEMAAGVAHEINQPLGIIFLSLENILFKLSGQDVSKKYLDKKLNSISDNIKKIKEIIDHIRIFSRDQRSIIIERVDINDVIRKSCSTIEEHYY